MSTNTTGYRDEHEFHDRVERRLHSARDYASVMHCYGTDDVHLPGAAADDPFTFEAGTVLAKLIALQDRVAEAHDQPAVQAAELLSGQKLYDIVIDGKPRQFGPRLVPSPAQELGMRLMVLPLLLHDAAPDQQRAERWYAAFGRRLQELPTKLQYYWWQEFRRAPRGLVEASQPWVQEFWTQCKADYQQFLTAYAKVS